MNNNKEKPENIREKIRQEELKKNTTEKLSDDVNRSQYGNLADLVGGLNWRITGVLVIIAVIVFIVISVLK
ncbi:phage capsid protein [Bacillus sp. FJAT-21945]|nr:phage capsid protein [Bacillus sp. FJAT-21945]